MRGPIPSIRVHWANFVTRIKTEHTYKGDDVDVLELPLWQFTPELVESYEPKPDLVYVPHKEKRNFDIRGIDTLYYMQTVFPWRFYVDSLGFAGGSSMYPFDITDGNSMGSAFDELRAYALAGGTKFDQPPIGQVQINSEYVLFPCQLPHDETIKYHSAISSEQALEETCRVTENLGIPLVVKAHPINPASMESQRNITTKYKHAQWVENVSIHDLIPRARTVVVVNSGTGMESLLRVRPVVTFGRCEYDCVTMKADLSGNLEEHLSTPTVNLIGVKKFFDKWFKLTYDTTLT